MYAPLPFELRTPCITRFYLQLLIKYGFCLQNISFRIFGLIVFHASLPLIDNQLNSHLSIYFSMCYSF